MLCADIPHEGTRQMGRANGLAVVAHNIILSGDVSGEADLAITAYE